MEFHDEFEVETNGRTYSVEVEGEMFQDDFELRTITIMDELGQIVGDENTDFEEVYNEAQFRDYEIELHTTDFDYYERELGKYQ